MSNFSPCYECSDRSQFCHAECERYKAWKEKIKVVDSEKEIKGYRYGEKNMRYERYRK